MHSLSIIKQTIKNVIANVAADRVKTFLTCLGIMFGTGSLIIMMTNYAIDDRNQAEDEKAGGEYYIDISVEDEHIRFSQDDYDTINSFDHVIGLSPKTSIDSSIRNGDVTEKTATLMGIGPDYINVGECIQVVTGRAITDSDVDNDLKVCLMSGPLAVKMFGSADPVGEKVEINGIFFKVVGICHKRNETSRDKEIYIPYTTAWLMTGHAVNDIMVFPDSSKNAQEVNDAVEEYVKDKAKSEDNVSDPFYYYDSTREKMVQKLQQYLVAVLTMLIGGIGIMNMMHVMVTERTVEIGLRKALGATPGRIQAQFVAEAVVISLLGGMGGIVLGLIGSIIVCVARSEQFILKPASILISLAFSMIVGVIFGWLPAKSASRLNAIDALKGE